MATSVKRDLEQYFFIVLTTVGPWYLDSEESMIKIHVVEFFVSRKQILSYEGALSKIWDTKVTDSDNDVASDLYNYTVMLQLLTQTEGCKRILLKQN